MGTASRRWPQPRVVGMVQLTGGPSGFENFLELSKPTQNWKLKMDDLLCSKNFQIFLVARLGSYEQLSQLC
jgi:hypothetical protein